MDGKELFDLFGLNAEEADILAEESAEGEEISNEESAEGEDISNEESTEGEDAQEHGSPASEEDQTPPEPPKEQTREERARHAAARRRAEQQAAVDAAVAKATERFDKAIQAVGIPNPQNGGNPFRSLKEIEEYKRTFDGRARAERMASGNPTEEDIRAIVSEMPEVKAAAAVAQQARAAEAVAFEREVEEQMRKIHELDPSIDSLEDILTSDCAEVFSKAVREHRMNYLDAFRFANMDKLAAMRQENARREEAARHEGKSHLKTTTSRGNGTVVVPAAEMALYKQLMPEATEAEIRRHYGQYKK